jgi:hypothetical protein
LPIFPTPAGNLRYAGGCLQPVLLRGRVDHIDGATGELLHRYITVHEPGGVLPIACKTRRASRCPPCAEVYRADTYQLIRAGLTGGKGVPEAVADHPYVFTTLTAPSFGPVHVQREKDGRVLRCRPAEAAESVSAAVACPATPSTLAMTHGSANRCVLSATTTPARCCSTPALPNCAGVSPSPCRNGAGLSPRTVEYVHAVLRKALRDAVIVDQILPSNPVERAKRPRNAASEPWQVWTPGQLRAFLDTARQHRLFAFYRLAAYAGARRGELLNLRWRDIDMDAREVRITGSAAVIAGQRIEGTTKSGRSRTVSIDAETAQVLRDHRKRQAEERLRVGPDWRGTDDYVFATG